MAGYIWGASTPDAAVERFGYLEGHGGPDDSPEDKTNFSIYQAAKTLLDRRPTGSEFELARVGGVNSLQSVRDRDLSAQAEEKQKSVTSSFLSGFSQYGFLADKGLTPSEAATIITMDQQLKANQTTIEKDKAVPNAGELNGAMNLLGGRAANASGKAPASIGALLLIGLAAFFFLRKK